MRISMSIILRQNEDLIKVVRRHKVFVMPIFLSWPLLVVAGFAARYLLNFDFFGYWVWSLVFLVLITFLIILSKYFIWHNNTLVITSQRVVKNEQKSFFSKTVTELLYDDISEISYSKEGINASIYD